MCCTGSRILKVFAGLEIIAIIGISVGFLLKADAALFCLTADHRLDAISVMEARQQIIDRDVVCHGLAREAGDESGKAESGAGGKTQHIDRHLHRARGDIHDAAKFARDHVIDRGLDHFDRRQHVGI